MLRIRICILHHCEEPDLLNFGQLDMPQKCKSRIRIYAETASVKIKAASVVESIYISGVEAQKLKNYGNST
jgi:hypothetical protein